VAERDQLAGALGRLDAGNARHGQHIALGQATARDQGQRFRAHAHEGLGHGLAMGDGLVAHIHHACMAVGIEMGQG